MTSQNILILVFVAFCIWYLSNQAGRLDRLHHRIDVAELALHGQLLRRGGIVAELAAVPGIDPAMSVLWGQAAHEVLILAEVASPARTQVEDELSEILEMTLGDRDEVNEIRSIAFAAALLDELTQVSIRIQMSHQFHSDAVRDCLEIRQQFLVRFCHLAGFAKPPARFALTDQSLASLSN